MPTTHEKICSLCGKPFIAHRLNVKYCSTVCRIRAASKEVVKPTYIKTCKYCGKEFETTNNRKMFCNKECYSAYTENERHEASKLLRVKRTCVVCGKEFETTSNRKITCSAKCSDDNIQHKAKKRYKTLSGNRIYHNVCIICGKEYTTCRSDQLCCSYTCSAAARIFRSSYQSSSDNSICWYNHKDTNFDKKIHNLYKDYEEYCANETARNKRPVTFSQYYVKQSTKQFAKKAAI